MGSLGREENPSLVGNGIVGIVAESINIWERRAPLTPSHCGRLLLGGKGKSGITRIIVQPSTKRIHHDAQYEDAGCEISDDLSECGLIIGIKQPKIETILPDRAYAFFSHTHKAQQENMPLLDKILDERVSLYDYELIVGEDGKRLLAFGKFAGRAGLIDFLHGLGQRYLNLGYSTPFLSLGASHMYPSLAAAKSAVIAVGEEIATLGLPSGISPIVFVFTGDGNVSQGAQEIFKLLPHTFVGVDQLPELYMGTDKNSKSTKRVFQVYGCIITSQDMVAPKDPTKSFSKADYYTHPEHYNPVFHERVAPYASVIVNCMYWEKRFPRLLSTKQLQDLVKRGCPLLGVCDITCDIGGSIEFVNKSTSIESPFFRYNPYTDSYHDDMTSDGVICLAVDILPTEFSREASQHFGDILSQFVTSLASAKEIDELPSHLRKACIAHKGALTPLYEYIPRMRKSFIETLEAPLNGLSRKKYTTLVSLSGHLFDKFQINKALDIIESAGGSFHLVRCEVGQSTEDISYSELEVGADDISMMDKILDSLTTLANSGETDGIVPKESELSLKIGKVSANDIDNIVPRKRPTVLILGAGRVCHPAAVFLASTGKNRDSSEGVHVIVASLFQEDADETVEGITNATAVQLDVKDLEKLSFYVSQVEVVVSLLPPSFHSSIANVCIEHKKHMVTASYVDDSMSKLDSVANSVGVTILCEMGLDPGIDHMVAMKMIDEARKRGGKIKGFTSYCGGLPSPAAANNPLAYKFSWNPAGAIRAGRNSAIYKLQGETVNVDGKELYDSAKHLRLSDLPAFALEHLPNRNSLIYGDLYGISKEASTIYRATLRYEGFSEIMATLGKLGFFEMEPHPFVKAAPRPTFQSFFNHLLGLNKSFSSNEEDLIQKLVQLGHCKDKKTAYKTVKAIKFLGLHEDVVIPESCSSAFEIICARMEERLTYKNDEQDMVLLHHEVELEFPNDGLTEKHLATLLEFGKIENRKSTSAMALTVGVPAAIGALLLIQNRVQKRGVVRPLDSEVYIPALEMLEAAGIKLMETVESL
ncbi:Lysine ketoglutarate reductase/saccharopine dehydrogenase [Rhynchospora pubera]|uniref:Lysine ketoglutarate reductase/saccharopine dehydrogenase n=1 Tax=Rhynchospora pubera TaxID=906938 RepID=A0AAV8FHA5_9POAL|nr:Lysine ketoglutarate reductase/saccharopine dehydrogenase [Rhynchospora pubera]